jgi:broad specificity phosphatase PhoE/aminoglycoside phosphotransferase (APT) family kinase protein
MGHHDIDYSVWDWIDAVRLVLVRHGQSVGNTKKGYISGASDPDGLTARGKAQIIRSGWELELRGTIPTSIISSPVARAKESGKLLSRVFHSNLTIDPDFSELDHGVFEGNYWWEVINTINPEWHEAFRDDFTTPYPNGESFYELAVRVRQGLKKLFQQENNSETILLTTHDAVIGTCLYLLEEQMRLPDSSIQFMRFLHEHVLANGLAVVTEINKDAWKIVDSFEDLQPVILTQKNLSFYCQALGLVTGEIKVEEMPSVSVNSVFYLQAHSPKTELAVKVVNQKDSVEADRLQHMYTYLEAKHIPAPKIQHLDSSGVFFPQPVVIQDFSPGITQLDCLCNHTHTELNQIFADVFSYLQSIHEIPVEEVSAFWNQGIQVKTSKSIWKDYMIHQIDLTQNSLSTLGLPRKTIEVVSEALLKIKMNTQDNLYREVPLHGDVSPQNILVGKSPAGCGFIKMLDFERAKIGDQIWDLAYYHGWLERLSPTAADLWQKLCAIHLQPNRMQTFFWYRILFHAWTIRDTLTYPTDNQRQEVGIQSRRILMQIEAVT